MPNPKNAVSSAKSISMLSLKVVGNHYTKPNFSSTKCKIIAQIKEQ